jgi:hypothetical protein
MKTQKETSNENPEGDLKRNSEAAPYHFFLTRVLISPKPKGSPEVTAVLWTVSK